MMVMPLLHPRVSDRAVLVGDRVRLRVSRDATAAFTVVAVRWSDLDRDTWIDVTDGVYIIAITLAEIEGFVDV